MPQDRETPISFVSNLFVLKVQNSGSFSYPLSIKRQNLSISDSVFSIGQLLAIKRDSFVVEQEPIEPRASL